MVVPEKTTERYFPGTDHSAVTCVRIRQASGPHASLTVWNRGGNAGTLTVLAEDAEIIAQRLLQLPDEDEA